MLTFMQQSLPQNSSNLDYTASYYAHVNGSGASGQKAVLISRITFKGSDTSQDLISTLYFTLHYNIQKIYFAIITKKPFLLAKYMYTLCETQLTSKTLHLPVLRCTGKQSKVKKIYYVTVYCNTHISGS